MDQLCRKSSWQSVQQFPYISKSPPAHSSTNLTKHSFVRAPRSRFLILVLPEWVQVWWFGFSGSLDHWTLWFHCVQTACVSDLEMIHGHLPHGSSGRLGISSCEMMKKKDPWEKIEKWSLVKRSWRNKYQIFPSMWSGKLYRHSFLKNIQEFNTWFWKEKKIKVSLFSFSMP